MEPKLNTNTDITTILREIEVALIVLLIAYMEKNDVDMDIVPQEYSYILGNVQRDMVIMPEGGGVTPPSDDAPVL